MARRKLSSCNLDTGERCVGTSLHVAMKRSGRAEIPPPPSPVPWTSTGSTSRNGEEGRENGGWRRGEEGGVRVSPPRCP
jgi:hypothetical protein